MEGSGSFHTPAVLLQGKNTCTHLTGCWISGRASLKFAEKRKIRCVFCSLNAEFDTPTVPYQGDLAKKKMEKQNKLTRSSVQDYNRGVCRVGTRNGVTDGCVLELFCVLT